MANLVEVVDALGEVRLAPVVVPILKMLDPIMGSLPQGSLQSVVSRNDRSDNLVRTVESASPALPEMIAFLGHLSESRLATGSLSLGATASAPLLKILAPFIARLIPPLSGPALGISARSGRVLPPAIGFLDRVVRAELFVEKSLSRTRGTAQ